MAQRKEKVNVPGIREIGRYAKPDTLLPVFCFFGEDSHTIDGAIGLITGAAKPLLESDFDKEVISADKSTDLNAVIDAASAFPFGSGKRLIVVKNIELIKDLKPLTGYLLDPPDFTILILAQYKKQENFKSEPYKSLLEKHCIFDARFLKGPELAEWLVKKAEREGYTLIYDNAVSLIDISGEEKSFLEMQLQKIYNFIGDRKEITFDDIKFVSSAGKQYSIFDLNDAIRDGNKARALEVGYMLLDNGFEITSLIGNLTSYLVTVARAAELSTKMNDNEASRKVQRGYRYYVSAKNARYFMKRNNIKKAFAALLNADLSVKTTAVESKTIFSVLIAEMFG